MIASLLAAMVSSVQAAETMIDFEAENAITLNPGETSLAIGNVTFDGLDGIFGLLPAPSYLHADDYSGNRVLVNGGTGFSSLKFSFANVVSDFSFNFGGNDDSDWELEAFDLKGQSVGSLIIDQIGKVGFQVATNNGQLFGLSTGASEGISYATLTSANGRSLGFLGLSFVDTVGIDNFRYTENPSNISPIPEPSTYALMLGGLGMVGFMAYRRRKTA